MTRNVNGRRHFSLKERHPIIPCVLCLYRTGLGVGRIEKITRKNKSLCFRWVRKAGILDSSRAQRHNRSGPRHGVRLLDWECKAENLIMWEYKREQRLAQRPDGAWKNHQQIKIHRQRHRRLFDPRFKAIFYTRKRVRQFCKQASINKRFSTSKLLGCDTTTLKRHIESKFRDGMSWANHGLVWHIDHITPLASATTERQVKALCVYTNLQPLLVLENIRKGDKMMRQGALL